MTASHPVKPFAAHRDDRPPSTPHQRLKSTLLGHSASAIFPTIESEWVFHPDGDDIAVYQPSTATLDLKDCKINYVGREHIIGETIIDTMNIGPGDDVFVVGRFINHEGRQLNLPTARFGCIGQMPWDCCRRLRAAGLDPQVRT
jgi:hypothetical protein